MEHKRSFTFEEISALVNRIVDEFEDTMLFRDALYKVIAKAERISRRTASKVPL